MNLSAELRKPLFIRNGRPQTLLEARGIRTELNASEALVNFSSAASKEMVKEAAMQFASQRADEMEQLIISRLQAVPEAKFRFLDGRTFTGTQAAEEIKRHSREGEFFIRLEKRTIQIFLNELEKFTV